MAKRNDPLADCRSEALRSLFIKFDDICNVKRAVFLDHSTTPAEIFMFIGQVVLHWVIVSDLCPLSIRRMASLYREEW